MNLEELILKEHKLTEELKQIREEIQKIEQVKSYNLLTDVIKNLSDVDSINLGLDCYLDVYCEECENEFTTKLDLSDIIQSLKELRDSMK